MDLRETLKNHLPPPNSIVAFEAAARHGSFTKAAEELGVTQAAISRQIRKIEDYLGKELFRPAGRGRELTDDGQSMFEAVTIGLAHVATAAMRIRERSSSPYLTIGMPLAFASLWLGPRIEDFRQAHADIDLRLMTDNRDIDPQEKNIDVAIRFGDGNWPHLRVVPLFQLRVMPVCSPEYLARRGPISSMTDLWSATLLDRDTRSEFSINWDQWFDLAGTHPPENVRRTIFDNYEVMIRAAGAGAGVALGVDLLVHDLIEKQFLVAPLDAAISWGRGYYLVMPNNREPSAQAALFADWLKAAAAEHSIAVCRLTGTSRTMDTPKP